MECRACEFYYCGACVAPSCILEIKIEFNIDCEDEEDCENGEE